MPGRRKVKTSVRQTRCERHERCATDTTNDNSIVAADAADHAAPAMGNAESQPVRNVDKRTARRDHAPRFKGEITRFRQLGVAALLEEHAAPNRQVRVCVRRRPIFSHELRAGEFDVLTCAEDARSIAVHDCRMHADCRRLYCNHTSFAFDRVFDEYTDSAAVYADASAAHGNS